MKTILAVLLLAFSLSINAANCTGTGSSESFHDSNGNVYNTQTFGNTTTVVGHNTVTGKLWSQQSVTYRNITSTKGITDGMKWYATTKTHPNGNYTVIQTVNGITTIYKCSRYGC